MLYKANEPYCQKIRRSIRTKIRYSYLKIINWKNAINVELIVKLSLIILETSLKDKFKA